MDRNYTSTSESAVAFKETLAQKVELDKQLGVLAKKLIEESPYKIGEKYLVEVKDHSTEIVTQTYGYVSGLGVDDYLMITQDKPVVVMTSFKKAKADGTPSQHSLRGVINVISKAD